MTPSSLEDTGFEKWFLGLKPQKQYCGLPAKGTIAAALVVLERLREQCDLRMASHLTEGGAQIAGLTSSSLGKILARFGESRKFPSEAGRTNRGNNQPINDLLEALEAAGFGGLACSDRNSLINAMQKKLVGVIGEYYKLERLRFEYDPASPVRVVIASILEIAARRNQSGPVAQHLVGAKLALRFPDLTVDCFPYSAADDQSGRAGDFRIGNTAFHVTVAPNLGHVARCEKNISEGLAVFLLVCESKVSAAKALLETRNLQNMVAAESVESFVGQNISELAKFTSDGRSSMMAQLLENFNNRIRLAETDLSLLIEIPSALRWE